MESNDTLPSIGEFRQALGGDAEGLSDDQVAEFRDALYRFVEVALDKYLEDKNKELM